MASMNQLRPLTKRALRTRINLLFVSEPALGKTTMINMVADEERAADPNFFFLQLDGGTMAPTDVVMSMPNMSEKEIVRLIDGRLPNAHVTPDLRGMIYVGEWMLMGIETSRGFQKLINHEELGGFRIPDGVIFVADGNGLKHRSGGQQQSRAIMSRFMTIEMEFDPDYALDVAKANFHEKVASFLIRNPACLSNYTDVFENEGRSANDLTLQEGKMGIWANLRSWDRVSRIIRDSEATGAPVLPDEVSRNVGSGVAQTFEVWMRMLDNLATMEDILKHPDKTPVPEKMDESYALSTMLAMTVNKDTFKPIAVYMNRYPNELQASFFRLMNDRLAKAKDANNSAIRTSDEYKKWITAKHISKLLLAASE